MINEITTIASVWTNAQFLDGTALSGHALGLRIAAGNVPTSSISTGGWGGPIQDPLNSGQTPTMANFATLADALAGCATRVWTDACTKLFAAAAPPKGARRRTRWPRPSRSHATPGINPDGYLLCSTSSIRFHRSRWTASRNRQTCARFRSCHT